MPVLANAQHEKFCQVLAKGAGQAEAYKQVYGTKTLTSAESSSSILMTRPEVRDRVIEIMTRGAERVEVTIERIVLELERLALADVRELFTPDGSVKPVDEWSADLGAQVAGMTITERTEKGSEDKIREYKIKFWDKNAALALLAKYKGMIVEKHLHLVKGQIDVTVTDITPEVSLQSAAELYALTIGSR